MDTVFDLMEHRQKRQLGLTASFDLSERIRVCLLDLWGDKLQELIKIPGRRQSHLLPKIHN